MTDRWQPGRAGLIALWRYWDETFTFHNGRLLLRGPNGSGKSMALELLLPFLLDGDSSPAKLTSSGRLRGRLFDRLMTGSDEQSRTGYAWIEFTRDDAAFTVGARIRGSRPTNKTDVDLFTTTLRVGRDLHLLDATRTPLSRKALVEAIGDTGRVYASADEHRAAVRETLFPGFSAERYDSVIGALLALRKEKLSEKLDPDKLSSVLSEALPPLDDHDIAAVAEGFERLDRRRDALAELERDVDEVRQLARRQRGYAEVVVAGAAAAVRSAESVRDNATRTERVASDELATVQTRELEVRGQRGRLDTRREELDIEIGALKDSDAYRAGAGLADLRSQAQQLRAIAERESKRAAGLVARRDESNARAERATDEHETARANANQAHDELAATAERVGAEQAVAEAAALDDLDGADTLLTAWNAAQRARVTEVRAVLRAHEQAVTQRGVHEERVATAEQSVAEREAALTAAEQALDDATQAYVAAVHDWSMRCETVGVDRLRSALPTPPDDPGSVAPAVAEVQRVLAAEDAAVREQLRGARDLAEAELDTLGAERSRWESSDLVEPDGPPWRSSRAGRTGAPLWQLVDVAPGVDDIAVDGIEAALTASGLVDAWVAPGGRLDLGPDRADVQLGVDPVAGRTLGELLVPVTDAAVAPDVVRAVLVSIAIRDSAPVDADDGPRVVLATDGSYRLGSAVGRGPRRPATLLGAVARERHRLQRLGELDAAFAAVTARIDGLDRQVTALDQRSTAIIAELADLPDSAGIVATRAAAADAESRLVQAREALEAARTALRAAEDAVRAALRELTTLAARHGLPADADALGDVETGLAQLANAVGTWVRRRRDVAAAARLQRNAQETAEQAAADAREADDASEKADRAAAEVEHRVATLDASVGADYRQILDSIKNLGAELTAAKERGRLLGAEADALTKRVGALDEKVAAARRARVDAEVARDTMQRRLVAVLGALGADCGVAPEGPLDTATAVLTTARAIGARYEKLDASEQLIEQRSAQVAERVHLARAALGARADFDRELAEDGWWLLRTSAGGIRRQIGELVDALSGQLDEGRAELAAEEERLFEQTLAGSVRRALADRIRQARALVDAINDQLEAVKTAAAGVGVQLRWDVDPDEPPAVQAARALLLRDPADLSDQERAALQDFVRARVDQARIELEANAPWEARLRESLDYRAWHRFTLQVAHRDWTGYLPATSARLQRLSTGERSIALHLPMIASVAAHYADENGAPAGCPRLILLDELFAGVDTANRAQLFGAFTTWQLDAVFTSDHEWCQYADLDGIAIHYLHPPTNDEPVTSTRFTWDGVRRFVDPTAA